MCAARSLPCLPTVPLPREEREQSFCQRQPLPATAVPHMLRININKHGLPAPGIQIDRYDSSSVPPVGGGSRNKKRQIFTPKVGSTTGNLVGVGRGRGGDHSPPKVPGRVPLYNSRQFVFLFFWCRGLEQHGSTEGCNLWLSAHTESSGDK